MRSRWIFAAVLTAVAGVTLPPAPAFAREPSAWTPNTATSWPISPGGDNFLTGYAPTEAAPPFIGCRTTTCRRTGDADGPWLEWVTKISDLPTGAFPTAAIVADDGLLYVGGGATNSFLALDMETGLPVWRFAPDPRTDGDTAQYPGSNAPTLHNGLVYVTFSNGYLYALNAKTGRKIWSFRATDGYTDKTASRPADADHPRRSALDAYTDSSQPANRHPFGAVHPGVVYPKPHGRSAICTKENVAAFMTLAGWAYGIDATTGKPLWKKYVDAPEFPGEMVWPEYKDGGALKPQNSSLGSSTRRFEAVPGLACGNGEIQVLGSDGHLRFLEPRTGKYGAHNCGYTRPCESSGGGDVGPEYERLDVDANSAPVDMCAASGFNCDMAIGLGIPPLASSATGPGAKGGDYIVTTLDSRIIRLSWDEHLPLWRREYAAPLPFQVANTLPLALDHLEHGFIAQAVVGGPMALDPDVAGKGARPILYAASQDGHLYVLSISEIGGGLRSGDPQAPVLLARLGISPNEQVETPYTRRGEGGPWDYNQHALAGLVLGGGVLYVPTWDNKMFAYDVRDPSAPVKIWEHEITWDKTFKYPPFGKTFEAPLADVDNKIWSSPALLGGRLYFTANDGNVYAFNLRKPVKTVRNLVVLGSGLVPFLPEYTEALGTFDRIWTPDDWYKNQQAPPGFRLPGGLAGAGATTLLISNVILFWWLRRRGDITVEVREVIR
ncbi:MAG TPA: PQQ-binding-like beta-propeller repeat protein [Actinomycetota bacterium]